MPDFQSSSTAAQDYLEQIHRLIGSKGYARVADIAAALEIAPASVTTMIQRLDTEGLVVYEKYRGVVLTADGQDIAEEVVKRHEVLARLLRSFGLDEKTIYQDVEGMEHHISKATLRVLITIVEELERNPKLLQKLREKM
ncbi:MAG: transcriptional regulator MntR [Verrucomicrobiaceae bacterium]